MAEFIKQTRILAPAREVFAWHEEPGTLEKLIPPWEPVTIEKRPQSLRDGSKAVLRIRVGPVPVRWVAEHRCYDNRGDAGGRFVDVQLAGPFRRWEHEHIIRAESEWACVLEDHIRYELPLGSLGALLGGAIAHRKLERMFEYRHRVTKESLERATSRGSAA